MGEMQATKTFEAVGLDGQAVVLTLRRPDFRSFKAIARKIAILLDAPFKAVAGTPEVEEVIRACVREEDVSGVLANLDYTEGARLWDALIEHAEFVGFFEKQRQTQAQWLIKKADLDAATQAAQLEALKKHGLLPRDFSLTSSLHLKRLEGLLEEVEPSGQDT